MTQKPPTKKSCLLLNSTTMITLLAIVCCTTAVAQVPANKKPDPISSIRQADKVVDIRERLVQLAMQNPNYEIADRKVAIANYQVKKAKGSWLGVIAVQGNVNEFSLKGSTTTANGTVVNPGSLYPKYNIGATIPLDVFSSKKNDIKVAKENLSIAQAEKNQRFREIKAEVLTRYEDYLLYQQVLDLQSQTTQDARTAYLASEKDFQEGSIKQEEYTKSYRAYIDEKVKQAQDLRNYNVIKLDLEKMIGITMEDLLKK